MRGNKLKIKALKSRKWCDKDYVLFHACFQLLVDLYEVEKMEDTIDIENSLNRDTHKQLKALYEWYLVRCEEEECNLYNGGYDVDTQKLLELVKLRGHMWS